MFAEICLTAIKNVKEKVEQFELLLQELPLANRVLLSWMIVHMTHVIARVCINHICNFLYLHALCHVCFTKDVKVSVKGYRYDVGTPYLKR